MNKFKVWLKRFDAALDFVVAKNTLTVNGETLSIGEPFDKTRVTARRLRLLYDSRRIAPVVEIDNPAVIAEIVTTIDLVPKIVKGQRGYMHVEVDGEKIGKSSRNEAKLADVVRDYLEG